MELILIIIVLVLLFGGGGGTLVAGEGIGDTYGRSDDKLKRTCVMPLNMLRRRCPTHQIRNISPFNAIWRWSR